MTGKIFTFYEYTKSTHLLLVVGPEKISKENNKWPVGPAQTVIDERLLVSDCCSQFFLHFLNSG